VCYVYPMSTTTSPQEQVMTRTRTLQQQINHELLTSAYGVHACGSECGQRPDDTPNDYVSPNHEHIEAL